MAFRPYGDLERVNNYSCNTAVRSGAIVSINSSGLVVETTGVSAAILGVAIGYADGTNQTSVAVADGPNQQYYAVADDASTFTTTDIGNNCSAAAGSPNMTVESGNTIDHTSKDTTSTRAFRIVGLFDNQDTGTLKAAIVRPNNHQEKAGVTGV